MLILNKNLILLMPHGKDEIVPGKVGVSARGGDYSPWEAELAADKSGDRGQSHVSEEPARPVGDTVSKINGGGTTDNKHVLNASIISANKADSNSAIETESALFGDGRGFFSGQSNNLQVAELGIIGKARGFPDEKVEVNLQQIIQDNGPRDGFERRPSITDEYPEQVTIADEGGYNIANFEPGTGSSISAEQTKKFVDALLSFGDDDNKGMITVYEERDQTTDEEIIANTAANQLKKIIASTIKFSVQLVNQDKNSGDDGYLEPKHVLEMINLAEKHGGFSSVFASLEGSDDKKVLNFDNNQKLKRNFKVPLREFIDQEALKVNFDVDKFYKEQVNENGSIVVSFQKLAHKTLNLTPEEINILNNGVESYYGEHGAKKEIKEKIKSLQAEILEIEKQEKELQDRRRAFLKQGNKEPIEKIKEEIASLKKEIAEKKLEVQKNENSSRSHINVAKDSQADSKVKEYNDLAIKVESERSRLKNEFDSFMAEYKKDKVPDAAIKASIIIQDILNKFNLKAGSQLKKVIKQEDGKELEKSFFNQLIAARTENINQTLFSGIADDDKKLGIIQSIIESSQDINLNVKAEVLFTLPTNHIAQDHQGGERLPIESSTNDLSLRLQSHDGSGSSLENVDVSLHVSDLGDEKLALAKEQQESRTAQDPERRRLTGNDYSSLSYDKNIVEKAITEYKENSQSKNSSLRSKLTGIAKFCSQKTGFAKQDINSKTVIIRALEYYRKLMTPEGNVSQDQGVVEKFGILTIHLNKLLESEKDPAGNTLFKIPFAIFNEVMEVARTNNLDCLKKAEVLVPSNSPQKPSFVNTRGIHERQGGDAGGVGR